MKKFETFFIVANIRRFKISHTDFVAYFNFENFYFAKILAYPVPFFASLLNGVCNKEKLETFLLVANIRTFLGSHSSLL